MATNLMGWAWAVWALLPHFTDEETGVREGRDPALSKMQMGKWVLGEGPVPSSEALSPGSIPPALSGPYPSQSASCAESPAGDRGCNRPPGKVRTRLTLGGKGGSLRPGPQDTPLLGQTEKGLVHTNSSAANKEEPPSGWSQKFSDLIKINLQLFKCH